MKERGILFSAPMVRALLDGSKTQTRRPAKPRKNPSLLDGTWTDEYVLDPDNREWLMRDSPYGQPGDRLWVRETCAGEELSSGQDGVRYTADDVLSPIENSPRAAIDWLKLHTYGLKPGQRPDSLIGRRVPSIHMPRWASRILLEITSVRVERLIDITSADARAEGLHRYQYDWRDCEYPLDDVAYEPFEGFGTRYSCASQAYRALWETINGAGSWDANPWVWVIEFRRIER